MRRRDFLTTTASGLGSGLLLASLGRSAWAAGQCLVPWSPTTPMVSFPAKKPPYRIALSNSYIGNTWRTEMVQLIKAYSEQPAVKPLIKEFRVSSSGNDVSAQIAQMNQMILGGVDAIVIDAATPAGLNSVIDQAVSAGIPVVSFDNVVTTKKAIAVNQNQYDMGHRWAEFVVKHIGSKGHVLMVRGVAGTFVDQELTRGGKAVFSKHPGIKITEVYGKWDDGTAQKATANALANTPQIDAVWCQGGDTGVVRAFQQAGHKIPVIAGEAENGFRKLAAKYKFPMLSIGQSPALSAMSLKVALDLLQGKKVPRAISVPLQPITTGELKAGVNYFPDQPDNFFMPINIAPCDIRFELKEVLQQKV